MRKITLRSALRATAPMLLTLCLGATLDSTSAIAQPRPRRAPAAAPAAPKGGKGAPKATDIEIDEPATPGTPAAAGGARKDMGPPPTAGQMTDAAAKAKRMFNNGDFENAALELFKVKNGDTADDEGNKQLAQFDLAIALYNKKYYQAAYGIFSEIAEKPNHLKFNQTLLWLAKLATELPEPADIVERVGRYNEQQIAAFKNDQQIDLYWQLNYLLGRYKYRNRQYEDAIRLFGNVAKQSKYYIKASFFSGIAFVQQRKSVPAVQSFQKVVAAIDEGVEGVDDDARMRDLAYLSQARTYYSASVLLDPETSAPKIDQNRLSAAVKYWNKVDVGSEYWLDGLFEESWAYFMAGDYPHALGNIHSIQAPYFPNAYYPEADILKAVIFFSSCQYDDSTTVVARFQVKYQPIFDDLKKVLDRFKGDNQEEAFFAFLKQVRDGSEKANLTPRIKTVVASALSDRQLIRHLKYVDLLDEEAARFKKASPAFINSALGNDVKDSLQLARDIAVRNAGQLARDRYQRNLDELNEHLRDGAKILIDINAAKRNQLDAAIAGSLVTGVDERERNIVKDDAEHVIWPFDGEYWRDELGFYRQTVRSKCSR
jgi:hypothetical protein